MLVRAVVVALVITLWSDRARAQDADAGPPSPDAAPIAQPPAAAEPPTPVVPVVPVALDEPEPDLFTLPPVALHGFVSQGAFVSTANDYLGHSSRGSLELTEAAINVSTEPADRLRVGLQLFARDVGYLGDLQLGVDWAYLDYAYRPWLGIRAGRVKIPFGLYNEFSDVDSARLPILLPQGVYPIATRDLLLAQNGFAIYGTLELAPLGAFDYQAFVGSLFVDERLSISGVSRITGADSKYLTGGQLHWRPPVEGLRLGGSIILADLELHLALDAAATQAVIDAGLAPPGFDGAYTVEFDPASLWIGSLEYVRDDWQVTAEYSRWQQRVRSSLDPVPTERKLDSERFYAMASYRVSDALEAGLYYAVKFADTHDRGGDGPQFTDPDGRHRAAWAWQRDLALSLRYDVDDAWLWKVEGHFIDGLADLVKAQNPEPTRFWGLVLVKTTVSF
jgi:hypothetical protein